MTRESQPVRLGAVGDILLTDRSEADAPRVMGDELSRQLERCDIVLANLECTLPGNGPTVPTEPRVVTTPGRIRAALAWGVDVVCLANNHMFDHLDAGFRNTRQLLDELGIPWFGAGETLEEATQPAIVKAADASLAFIGAVDHRSGPARFATPDGYGVAPLDVSRLMNQIGELRADGHRVIVSVHWGEERFLIPSPQQIEAAHRLAEAGAVAIIGHHPHVVQGLETRAGVPVIYSLGNFVADPIAFSDGDVMTWNATERIGCLLTAALGDDHPAEVTLTPTRDDGSRVDVDHSRAGRQRIDRTARALARGVTLPRYRREHFRVKVLTPALARLRWSRLKKLRPANVARALRAVFRSTRAE